MNALRLLWTLAGTATLVGLAGCADGASGDKIVREPLYCYRTLAEITCYEMPDPQASASRLVR